LALLTIDLNVLPYPIKTIKMIFLITPKKQ